MLRKYIKAKRAEIKVKAAIYTTIANFIDNKKDIIELIHKAYEALKDVPAEELQKELVNRIAEIAHNENSAT